MLGRFDVLHKDAPLESSRKPAKKPLKKVLAKKLSPALRAPDEWNYVAKGTCAKLGGKNEEEARAATTK